MMPPMPGDARKWFVPYLYTPSDDAAHASLVTPWGAVKVARVLHDNLVDILIAMVIVAVTVGAWRAYISKREATPTRPATKEEGAKRGKASSALEDNIQTKGANSYYYAHQRRVTDDSAETKDSLQKTKVSSYSWTDQKKTISIYLTDDVVAGMDDEQLKLNWSTTSLSMDLLVAKGSKLAKSLVIPTLYDEITNVTWKVRKSQLVITLHKKNETPWKSLNGAAKNLEDHIEYDESLFD